MRKICETHDSHMIVAAKFTKQEDGTFCNARLLHEMNKRRAYSESRRQNRLGKADEDMNDTSESYVTHMENEIITVDRDSKGGVGEKKEKDPKTILIESVVLYLNEKTKSDYKPNSKLTVKYISGRINDGYTLDDFKLVIDSKTKQWLNDPNNNMYLRPETLFNSAKFEGYLFSAKRKMTPDESPKSRYEAIIATIGPDTSKEDIAFAYDYQRKTGDKEQYGGKWIMERNHPLTIEVYQEQTYGHIPAHMR